MQEDVMFFRMNKTILQMMRDRGYEVDQKALEATIEQFRANCGSSFSPTSLTKVYRNKNGDRILVCFDPIDRVDTKTLAMLTQKMHDTNVTHMVLVARPGILTPIAARAIEKIKSSGLVIDYFDYDEVIINVTEHELVPKHEILSDEEKGQVLQQYNVNDTQLPRIPRADPVCRYFGASPGQLIRITRDSQTAGKYVTYRLVF